MTKPVIEVKNLSKQYTIGEMASYGSLREEIMHAFSKPFKRFKQRSQNQIPGSANNENTIWALKDVSFDVQEGEVLGIIGRNGAGKSTILKILSRITEPTEGEVRMRGRVGSLLEVGTGFHPELTGRENIYLNGALLGMQKEEIKKNFDEIVAFSEIEKFLNTPVKRYSSGMYVRLAFAVAAHLEPEILIVDEVLAVGDVAFQKKCLGKMGDVAKGGRTVLFVSHNMAAVRKLCSRVILLSSGKLSMDGPSDVVINSYIYDEDDKGVLPYQREYDISSSPGDKFVRLRQVLLVSDDGTAKSSFRMDEKFSVEIFYEVLKPISNFHLYIRLNTQEGILAFCSADWDGQELQEMHRDPGEYIGRLTIPPHLLNVGTYMLSVLGIIHANRVVFEESPVLTWKISSSGGLGGTVSVNRRGIFRPLLQWSHREKGGKRDI